jgi:hypothetical protein
LFCSRADAFTHSLVLIASRRVGALGLSGRSATTNAWTLRLLRV